MTVFEPPASVCLSATGAAFRVDMLMRQHEEIIERLQERPPVRVIDLDRRLLLRSVDPDPWIGRDIETARADADAGGDTSWLLVSITCIAGNASGFGSDRE